MSYSFFEYMLSNSQKEINFPYCPGKDLHSLIPSASSGCIDLLKLLLTYNPSERITAREALRHPFFAEVMAASGKDDPSLALNTVNSARNHRKLDLVSKSFFLHS
jgi:serine/threonine protein kinase